LNPFKTDKEYLPWLASWLGLTLRADLPEENKRNLIARATYLYAWRGTHRGLAELISIVTGGTPEITEPEIVTLTVGLQAVVGSSTRLGRDLPFYFHVNLSLPGTSLYGNARANMEALTRDTIEFGKPAHTYYNLEFSAVDDESAQVLTGGTQSHASRGGRKNADTSQQQ
jgi:hypothetical protein